MFKSYPFWWTPSYDTGKKLRLTAPATSSAQRSPKNRTLHCTTPAQAAARPMITTTIATSFSVPRVIEFTGWRVEGTWSFHARAPSPDFLALTVDGNFLSLDQTDDLRQITKRSIPTIQRTLSTKRKTTSLRLSSCARKCYSTRPCVHVPSLHIHLDIAHNSSSYSLIIIIRSLPRSTGSFPSNNERNGSKFITCRACVRMSSLLDRATVMMTEGIW